MRTKRINQPDEGAPGRSPKGTKSALRGSWFLVLGSQQRFQLRTESQSPITAKRNQERVIP